MRKGMSIGRILGMSLVCVLILSMLSGQISIMGGGESNHYPVLADTTEIIIDTEIGEARFTTYPGRDSSPTPYWVRVRDHGSFRTRAYDGNYWYTLCGEEGHGEPLYFGVWQASLPRSGEYEVFVWIPDPDPFQEHWHPYRVYRPTERALYQVYHKDGATNVLVNQRLRTGDWHSLGRFQFDTSASIILNDRTGEPIHSTMVAYDAVRFVKTDGAPTPAVEYITITPKYSEIVVGDSQSYTVEAFDQHGNSIGDVTSSATIWSLPSGCSRYGNTLYATRPGTYNVYANYAGKNDTATLDVAGRTLPFIQGWAIDRDYEGFDQKGLPGCSVYLDGVLVTTTDENGHFFIPDLSPRSYLVRMQPPLGYYPRDYPVTEIDAGTGGTHFWYFNLQTFRTFEFHTIGPQRINAPFDVTIWVRDPFGNLDSSYSGEAYLDVYAVDPPPDYWVPSIIVHSQDPEPPEYPQRIQFADGVWSGTIELEASGPNYYYPHPPLALWAGNPAGHDPFGSSNFFTVTGSTALARASDISGQPQVMSANTEHTVTAKYFNLDGREDIGSCHLRLRHPDMWPTGFSKSITMWWRQTDGSTGWHWSREEFLTMVNVEATPIVEGGLEGYELTWTFMINDQWPEVENAIDFGVFAMAKGYSGGVAFDYDNTKASFLLTMLPDLWISEIKPIQVVWNSDINSDGRMDLVAGKATMVRVYVGMKDYEGLPLNTPIEVQLTFDGVGYTETRRVWQLIVNNKQIDFYPASPITIGHQAITAVVDPDNNVQETDTSNNQRSINVVVRQTDSLYLYYVPVNRPTTYFGYGPIDMELYRETANKSGEFVLATYPLAEGRFTNDARNWPLFAGSPVPLYGMILDVTAIWTVGKLATLGQADVSTGIVPDDYFAYHLMPRAKGVTVKGVAAALGEVGYWTAVAHEAGHVFGLWTDKEQYGIVRPGFRADGFWVDERSEIVNGASFMGVAGAYRSFSHTATYDYRPVWVADVDYADLFSRFNPGRHGATGMESDILLVTGIISKDGRVELGKLYMVEGGTLERPAPGDYSAQILDSNGNLLKTVSFDTGFEMSVNPLGIIETDYAAFALTIPYPDNTAKLQVQHLGETLIEVNPNIDLLHDAVDSIPDHGFVNNPSQRRRALHSQIDAVEEMIERGELRPAINMLERNIMDRFQKWLVAEYSVESSLQLSKVEVINLTQAIIDRLASQL